MQLKVAEEIKRGMFLVRKGDSAFPAVADEGGELIGIALHDFDKGTLEYLPFENTSDVAGDLRKPLPKTKQNEPKGT